MGNRVTNTSISGNDHYILSGRGRGNEKHGGNKKFRRLVNSHAAEYNDKTTRRKQKSLIIEAVWEQLVKDSMCIVKRINDTTWVEMDEDEAKIKIGHALRDTKMAIGERTSSDQAKDGIKALAKHNSAVKTSLL